MNDLQDDADTWSRRPQGGNKADIRRTDDTARSYPSIHPTSLEEVVRRDFEKAA